MINKKPYLRKANKDDVEILFEWVNDKKTRENAFNTHVITYEEHCEWFKRMIEDPKQVQYIMMVGEKPVGQVRITIENQEADIDYSISSSERGRGYGKEIIALIKEKVQEDCPTVKKLIGRVKPYNIASYCCFTGNEFEEVFKQLEFVIN